MAMGGGMGGGMAGPMGGGLTAPMATVPSAMAPSVCGCG